MWADNYVADLRAGKTVSFRPRGHSMAGRIESGQLVTVVPATLGELFVGDIVLCKVGGSQYLHLVKGLTVSGDNVVRVLIGNNKGRVNGWTKAVYGKVIKIDP